MENLFFAEIQELLPLVAKVNKMTRRLQKNKEFHMVIIPAEYKFPEDDDEISENRWVAQHFILKLAFCEMYSGLIDIIAMV